jgi:HTH-type transcriptional regulator/antitoxin HigA
MVDRIENEYSPSEVSLPGETLREVLEERQISQSELAKRMGRPKKTISEIINGKAAITPATALQLELVLGITARFWNAREQHFREYLARRAQEEELERRAEWAKVFPYSAMVKEGLVEYAKGKPEKVKNLLGYFGVSSPEQWNEVHSQPIAAYRRSTAFEADSGALAAWLRAGVLEADEITCRSFDRDSFVKALVSAKALTREPPEVFQPALVDSFADAGVAVTFVPQLPKSRVSGATRWLSPTKAMIQLSLRYKTDDHLWFTFFHEAAHILLHGKRLVFLEGGKHEGELEQEANQWAADFLIPPVPYSEFVRRSVLSKQALAEYADRLGIAPGILVGRLQHEGHLPHSHRNELKRRFEWVREAN